MKHVLCPFDGSDPSKRAVAVAALMALRMQAKLTILYVREYVIGRTAVYELTMPDEAAQQLEVARTIASNEAYTDPDVVELRARYAAHAILDYAEKNAADLIVMGAAGKGAVQKFFIGSTSSDVMRKADCPVTIVH